MRPFSDYDALKGRGVIWRPAQAQYEDNLGSFAIQDASVVLFLSAGNIIVFIIFRSHLKIYIIASTRGRQGGAVISTVASGT